MLCDSDNGVCALAPYGALANIDVIKLAEIERIIMDWAAANPEPRYPSWEEWQLTNFSGVSDMIKPCCFMNRNKLNCGEHTTCYNCRNQPIPANIAEKLHIKPIGVKDDA